MGVTKGNVLQILRREMHELVDNPQKVDCIDYEALKKLLNSCNHCSAIALYRDARKYSSFYYTSHRVSHVGDNTI